MHVGSLWATDNPMGNALVIVIATWLGVKNIRISRIPPVLFVSNLALRDATGG